MSLRSGGPRRQAGERDVAEAIVCMEWGHDEGGSRGIRPRNQSCR